jgi:hypothetical protein
VTFTLPYLFQPTEAGLGPMIGFVSDKTSADVFSGCAGNSACARAGANTGASTRAGDGAGASTGAGAGASASATWRCLVRCLTPYQIYAFGGFLSVAFVYFVIPETRGRTLEEIKWVQSLFYPDLPGPPRTSPDLSRSISDLSIPPRTASMQVKDGNPTEPLLSFMMEARIPTRNWKSYDLATVVARDEKKAGRFTEHLEKEGPAEDGEGRIRRFRTNSVGSMPSA